MTSPPPRKIALPSGHGSDRRRLVVLVGLIVTITAVGLIGDALAPALINDHPLLQVFLNPRTRYLVAAAPQVDLVPFFVVGYLRLVLSDPLFYLLGYWYGDVAVRWMETKLGPRGPAIMSAVERWFGRAAYLVVILAPNGYVCLVAGATGMRPRVFLALNTLGTIGGLAIAWAAGAAFEEPIASALRVVSTYQWWLTGLSIAIVAAQLWRGRRRGSLPFQSVGEITEELTERLETSSEEDDAPRD